MKITDFQTDQTRETDGQWVDIGDGTKILVARIGNPKHKKAVDRLARPHRQQIRRDKLPRDVAEKLGAKALAETVLLGWENLEDKDGKPIPYSREKAEEILTDPSLKDFQALVVELASEMETFRAVEIEDAAKNSKRSSTGS